MQTNRATNPWLVRPKPNRLANFRLFCFPFAGGGASLFRLWPDQLPEGVELCAIQLPGRETRIREPIHQLIGPLIDDLVEALAADLDQPFALFGHSMGALVAFELTRELRRRNLPSPQLLIASGRIAPQLRPRRRPIHTLPEPEFRKELRLLDGTPQALLDHNELMSLFSPIIRADLAVNATYIYTTEPPLPLPILALGGRTDPWVDQEELEGWRLQTSETFKSEHFPGSHFFLQTATAELLAVLSRALTPLQGLPA
ncbi:Surfactin synthase thioesterase subunit [Singulisphaera sp. GP187]|uniref:thioesterase II family protein n=1 Tax=Singulisphaera sp. GP187 TaxID=1882752 RepID=UPI00092722EC|nr:alpha/beta fold hydrolase [Singulisphaera sp. GP187]SIO60275.1 Surfactin synthase thioesterase subunit [Singulisphaera sp. GP187]